MRSLHAVFTLAAVGTVAVVVHSVRAAGPPSPNQVPLDPTTIPQFATQLPIPRTFAPTVITNSIGNVIRNEYTIVDGAIQQQVQTAGFPPTTEFSTCGQTYFPDTTTTHIFQSS